MSTQYRRSARSEPNNFSGCVADIAKTGGSKDLITSTSALTLASALVTLYDPPQVTSVRRVWQVANARQMGFEMFGTGANNAGWQASLWGYRGYEWAYPNTNAQRAGDKFNLLWRPRPIALFNGKLDGYSLDADAQEKRDPLTAGGATVRGSDTFAITADYTYNDTTKIVHEVADLFAALIVDTMSLEWIVMEASCLDPDTSANATGIIPFAFRL